MEAPLGGSRKNARGMEIHEQNEVGENYEGGEAEDGFPIEGSKGVPECRSWESGKP